MYYPGEVEKAFPAHAPKSRSTLNIGGNGAVDADALLAAVKAGKQWHNNLVRLTAHWVNEGLTDDEILAITEGLTLTGYTVDQTREEVQRMVSDGRTKWNLPNPDTLTTEAVVSDFAPKPAWNFDPRKIPAREWIIQDRIIKSFVSLIMAPGGASKSMLTMEEAVAVATGRSLTGMEIRHPGAAWVFNNEDPQDELQRRLAGIYEHWGIDQSEIKDRLFVNSGLRNRLIVAKTERNAIIQTPAVDALKAHIRANNIILLIVDPFVRSHAVDEQSNAQIDFVMQQFADIADDCDCAVSLVHHTRKTPSGSSYAGDMDSARGASALVYAVRSAHTLMEMTVNEAEGMGIKEDRRRWYVRFDNAKSNLSPPAEDATWFERVSVEIPNGTLNIGDNDQVGVLVPWDAPSSDYDLSPTKATEILNEVDEKWKAGEPFSASHQSQDRYLVTHLAKNHDMTKTQAKKVLAAWIKSEMVINEIIDANSKMKGLRVMKFPGTINQG